MRLEKNSKGIYYSLALLLDSTPLTVVLHNDLHRKFMNHALSTKSGMSDCCAEKPTFNPSESTAKCLSFQQRDERVPSTTLSVSVYCGGDDFRPLQCLVFGANPSAKFHCSLSFPQTVTDCRIPLYLDQLGMAEMR